MMARKPITKDDIFANTITTPRGCWEWQAKTTKDGYGYWGSWANLVHRKSYELFVGEIPEDMWLDHRCRNKLCVCPDHLYPVRPGMNTWLAYITKRGQLPWTWLRVARHLHRMVGDDEYRERVRSGEGF